MDQKLKILILSNSRIFPAQTGGHLRTGGFAKALARIGHEVFIYNLAGRREDYSLRKSIVNQSIEPGLTEQINLSLSIGLCQTLARRLKAPRFWQYPALRYGFMPSSLQKALQWADLIVCDSPYQRPLAGPWSGKPWLLLSHNLEHQLLRQGPWLDRNVWSRWMQKLESKATHHYAGILACAPDDRSFFAAHNAEQKPIILIPNGVDGQAYKPDASIRARIRQELGLRSEDRLIVFSGSRYKPNLDALSELRNFALRQRDFLRSQHFKFLILGSMTEAMRSDTLIATGFVPSVLPYFQAADFALNPVKRGSGSNVKIFEYLAAQLPILSTPFGVRGTDLRAHRDYVPMSISTLRECLQSLNEPLAAGSWKEFAQAAWLRHADQCDMTSIVKVQWKLLLNSLALDQAT